jgi:hypothetical protein
MKITPYMDYLYERLEHQLNNTPESAVSKEVYEMLSDICSLLGEIMDNIGRHKMAMFDDAKVGDRVWSHFFGWGIIKSIYSDRSPICIEFESRPNEEFYYTREGK